MSSARPGARAAVTVGASQYGSVPPLVVGQILVVLPAGDGPWQVDFDEALLERLTPEDAMRAPGGAGWRFRARGAGEGEIVLTSIVSGSAGPQPMPVRFVLVVKVRG